MKLPKLCNRRNCSNQFDKIVFNHRICDDCIFEFSYSVGDQIRFEREFIKLFVDFIMSDKTVGSGAIISLDQFIKKKYNE